MTVSVIEFYVKQHVKKFCMWYPTCFKIVNCAIFLLRTFCMYPTNVHNRKCWIYNKVIFIVISRPSDIFNQDLNGLVWLVKRKRKLYKQLYLRKLIIELQHQRQTHNNKQLSKASVYRFNIIARPFLIFTISL